MRGGRRGLESLRPSSEVGADRALGDVEKGGDLPHVPAPEGQVDDLILPSDGHRLVDVPDLGDAHAPGDAVRHVRVGTSHARSVLREDTDLSSLIPRDGLEEQNFHGSSADFAEKMRFPGILGPGWQALSPVTQRQM